MPKALIRRTLKMYPVGTPASMAEGGTCSLPEFNCCDKGLRFRHNLSGKPCTSEDPVHSFTLHFLNDGNEHRTERFTRNVSTQPVQEKSDCKFKDTATLRTVYTQTDASLHCDHNVDMLRRMIRNKSYELQELRSRFERLCTGTKSDRVEMKTRDLGSELKELKSKEKEEVLKIQDLTKKHSGLEQRNAELRRKITAMRAQLDHVKPTTSHPKTESSNGDLVAPTSSKLDKATSQFSADSDPASGSSSLVCGQRNFILQAIPQSSEMVTTGSAKEIHFGLDYNAGIVMEKKLSVDEEEARVTLGLLH